MLDQRFFGLPLWVWLVIVGIIGFSCHQTMKTSDVVQEETKEKFSEIVQTNDTTNNKPKTKVFNFNTEWCGWSRRFQPEWDNFSTQVKSNPGLAHVEALDVKCDSSANEAMCENYQVPGYPFVVIEVDGKRTHYKGERTADALVKYFLVN
jgi:thiol-disulfide isomerase/thioredoxin